MPPICFLDFMLGGREMFITLYLLYLANRISLKSQLLRPTRISIIRFLTASKRSYQNAGFGIEYYLFKLVSHLVMVTSYSLVFFCCSSFSMIKKLWKGLLFMFNHFYFVQLQPMERVEIPSATWNKWWRIFSWGCTETPTPKAGTDTAGEVWFYVL